MVWNVTTSKLPGIVLILILISTAAGCSSSRPAADLPDIGTIQVGYIPALTFAPFFIAYEKGYFAEQGLEVELHNFRSGPAMLHPLSTGALDVGKGAMSAAMLDGFHQALDLKIVAGGPVSQDRGQTEMPLMVRKDLIESGEVTTITNLKHHKVALNVRGGTADYLLSQALASERLMLKDVQVVITPIQETKQAFETGAIDAAPIAYPMADQFVQDDLALPLIPPGELGGTFQFGVLFFGKRLLEPSNHEVGVRFLSAYFKAERELYQQPALADETLVQIIHQYTNLPPHAIETSPLPTPVDGQIETDLLIKMQSYFMQQGYTEFARPIELDRMVDISYRDEALERLDAQSR